MKKTLLLVAIIATSMVAHATNFKFDTIPAPTVTAAPYTLSCIYLLGSDTVVNVTTILDDNFVKFAYHALNLTPGEELSFSYKDNADNVALGKKGLLYKRAEKAFIFDGSNRKLKLSGLTIGEEIVFSIGSKGSTANTFNVTGATADAGNVALTAKPSAAYSYINWKYTATATEAIFTVSAGGCIIKSIRTGAEVLTETPNLSVSNYISFNGTQILNTKGLSLEVYNVLGKKVAGSLTSISTANFQKGVYIVRASGLNDSLKICI